MPKVLVFVTMGGWILFEILLIVRDRLHGRGNVEADRGTRFLNAVLVVGAVVVAADLSGSLNILVVPNAGWFSVAGVAIICLGFALRVWAIWILGSAFRTTVEVEEAQSVVTEGPYRWIRHPSYTGMLLITLGFGIAFANWLSLALCAVLPTVALLRRIKVEESEMVRVLGDPYRVYSARTKRLIPGIW